MIDFDKEREAFNAWAMKRYPLATYVDRPEHFSNGRTDAAWEAWQARAAIVPDGYVLVPLDLLRRVSDVMGRFLSDEGWCMGDMDVSDELGALLAAQPQGEEVRRG